VVAAWLTSRLTDPLTVTQLQLKAVLFRTANAEGSFGALAGALRDTGAPHGSSAYQGYYAKGLASWYPRDDLEFDFNVGAANVRGAGTYALAGVAATWTVTRLQLLSEVFRDRRSRSFNDLRLIVVRNRPQTYASYGSQFGRSPAAAVVAGFRLRTPEFLPERLLRAVAWARNLQPRPAARYMKSNHGVRIGLRSLDSLLGRIMGGTMGGRSRPRARRRRTHCYRSCCVCSRTGALRHARQDAAAGFGQQARRGSAPGRTCPSTRARIADLAAARQLAQQPAARGSAGSLVDAAGCRRPDDPAGDFDKLATRPTRRS
jgi:hypothetical protein